MSDLQDFHARLEEKGAEGFDLKKYNPRIVQKYSFEAFIGSQHERTTRIDILLLVFFEDF